MTNTKTLQLRKIFHCIGEDAEAVGLFDFFSGPAGVVGFVDETFGMGHHAHDPAGGVAEAGDVVQGAVGVYWVVAGFAVLVDVAVGDLVVGFGLLEDFRGGEAYFAFAVGDGDVDPLAGLDKDALVGGGFEPDPAVFEFPGIVIGDRGLLVGLDTVGDGQAGQDAGLDQDLEAVTDSQDQFVGFDKFADFVAEMMFQLVGQDLTGGDVVAIAESAGQCQNLIIGHEFGIFDQPVNVHFFGDSAGQLKGVTHF